MRLRWRDGRNGKGFSRTMANKGEEIRKRKLKEKCGEKRGSERGEKRCDGWSRNARRAGVREGGRASETLQK